VFRIRGEIVAGYENRPKPGMAVLHLVAQREAVHRLQEHFRDQQIHLLPLGHVDCLLPRQRPLNLVARGSLEDIEHLLQILLTIHNEYFHTLLVLTFQAASAAAGRL
jgi:hypothetical protein